MIIMVSYFPNYGQHALPQLSVHEIFLLFPFLQPPCSQHPLPDVQKLQIQAHHVLAKLSIPCLVIFYQSQSWQVSLNRPQSPVMEYSLPCALPERAIEEQWRSEER